MPLRYTLRQLEYFVAVGETGSIGKAAEREFIAASAVSKRLAELESALGTALLYRHARGVDLTPAGQACCTMPAACSTGWRRCRAS